nr:MAG TPA: hypothetical protein [Caudoviricetes sp.]
MEIFIQCLLSFLNPTRYHKGVSYNTWRGVFATLSFIIRIG